jgi:heptosyltransferase-2
MPDKNIEINNILIIRLSSMGDVVLTSSFVRQLRSVYPKAKIDYIVGNRFTEVVKYNPNIDNVFEYDKIWSKNDIIEFKELILSKVENRHYDVIIDLQKNHRSRYLAKGLSNKILKIKKNRLNKLSLVYLKKTILKDIISIPEQYLRTAESIGVKGDNYGLELWLPEEKESRQYLQSKIEGADNKPLCIALAPGAFHYTKRWMPEAFSEIIRQFNDAYDVEFAVFGGADDIAIAKEIIDFSKSKINDYSGSDSIIHTARELGKCDLLITNDTGIMHIAAARQVPIVAIFGSTVPEFGFAPYRVKNAIVERKGLGCRPCTHIGRAECPKGHFKCMRQITASEVFNEAKKLLEK